MTTLPREDLSSFFIPTPCLFSPYHRLQPSICFCEFMFSCVFSIRILNPWVQWLACLEFPAQFLPHSNLPSEISIINPHRTHEIKDEQNHCKMNGLLTYKMLVMLANHRKKIWITSIPGIIEKRHTLEILMARNRNLNLKDQFPQEPRKAHV